MIPCPACHSWFVFVRYGYRVHLTPAESSSPITANAVPGDIEQQNKLFTPDEDTKLTPKPAENTPPGFRQPKQRTGGGFLTVPEPKSHDPDLVGLYWQGQELESYFA